MSLGKELNSTGHGIKIADIVIAAIFFADDLVIVGRTRKEALRLMKIVKRYFAKHNLEISEKKSKVMSYDATLGKETFEGFDDA